MRIRKLFPILFLLNNKISYFNQILHTHHSLQILSHYSIYKYNEKYDIYRYGSKKRRDFKRRFYPDKDVEDHHIIPKKYKNHKLIREINFDVGCSKNILIMRNRDYIFKDNTPYLTHEKGHVKYNKYVGEELDNIYYNIYYNEEERKYEFLLFFHYLQSSLTEQDSKIPWN